MEIKITDKQSNLSDSKNLNIIFAGTPEIAKTVLCKIINHDSYLNQNWRISLVLTQPDRPKGRGQKFTPSPVKEIAIQHGIQVSQPTSFKQNPEVIDIIKKLQPDIMIVVAYGLIIPESLLNIPKLGCINVHVSLLPKWRGAAPIQRAIQNGDSLTGITIMQMDAGLDTGDILIQKPVEISDSDNAQTLQDKLATIGAEALIYYLNKHDKIHSISQPNDGITYASKILKSEAEINWCDNSISISRQIRAFNPSPGCFTHLDGKSIKIWEAHPIKNNIDNNPQEYLDSLKPGQILKDHDKKSNVIRVVCGDNSILGISELQEESKKRQTAIEFKNGKNIANKIFD